MEELEYFRQYPQIKFVPIIKRTKKATGKGWQKEENAYSYDKIKEYIKNQNNYGVLCSGNLIVIDIDTPTYRKDGQNIQLLDKFSIYKNKVENELPETFTVKTGSGNRHYYFFCKDFKKFILDKEELINGSLEKTHYGEIQSDGSQVIGPGSILGETGNKYEILKNIQIATISKFDLFRTFEDFFNKREYQKKELLNFDEIDSLRLENIFSTSGLKSIGGQYQGPHPIHGSTSGTNFCLNSSKNTFYCFRCASGGGPAKAIAIKEGIINCGDRLEGENFKKTVKIAQEKYGLSPKVDITSHDSIIEYNKEKKIQEENKIVESPLKLQPFDFKTFMSKEDKKTYYVQKMFGSSTINMIFSPPKQMKSFISYHLALCLAQGENFLGQKCKKVPVCYFDWENPISDVQNRIKGICNGMNFDLNNINNFYLFPRNPTLLRAERFESYIIESLRDELIQFIKDNSIKVLFFDTLRRIGNFDENDSKAINTLKSELFDYLVRETQVCIIFLHHTSKEGVTYRGSVDIEGILDTSFKIKKQMNQEDITLTMECVARRNNEIDKITSRVEIEGHEEEDEEGDMFEIIDSVKFLLTDNEEGEEVNYKSHRDFFINSLQTNEKYINKELQEMLEFKFNINSKTTRNKIINWCTYEAKILIRTGDGKTTRYSINPKFKNKPTMNITPDTSIIDLEHDEIARIKTIEDYLHNHFKKYELALIHKLINDESNGNTGLFPLADFSLVLNKWNKKGWLNTAIKNQLRVTEQYKIEMESREDE